MNGIYSKGKIMLYEILSKEIIEIKKILTNGIEKFEKINQKLENLCLSCEHSDNLKINPLIGDTSKAISEPLPIEKLKVA